jgi:hypothetical protein
MASPSSLPDIHDATLVSVHFDWGSGEATLVFRTSPHRELRVIVSECIELIIPRHEEWGRSVSVMSARFVDGEADRGLIVEMQSGDRLTVYGRVAPPFST